MTDTTAVLARRRFEREHGYMRGHGELRYDEAGRPTPGPDPSLVRRARRLLLGG